MNSTSETPALTGEVKDQLDKLIKLCRILEIEGHGDRTLGFASVRDPHDNGMWIKRSHIALGEVFDYRDFFHIGLDGKVYSGEGRCHGEWPIHASIFEMRPDVNAAIHTHPTLWLRRFFQHRTDAPRRISANLFPDAATAL